MPALILLLVIGRSIAVFGGSLLVAITPWRIRPSWQHVLNIAGLKGAISIALRMALPADYEHRQLFICAAFALVLFTLIINPIVAQWYLRHTVRGDNAAAR